MFEAAIFEASTQPTMIKLEGELFSRNGSIMVDPGASLSYVNPGMV